jgi:hypothetical protein
MVEVSKRGEASLFNYLPLFFKERGSGGEANKHPQDFIFIGRPETIR